MTSRLQMKNPFHEGELSAQRRAKESASAQHNAGVISDSIAKGAIPFVVQQSLVVFGSIDPDGNPWASVLVGDPGFIRACDERTVLLDVQRQLSAVGDPLWANIEPGTEVGLLVIDLGTRRRLRVNGHIRRLKDTLFELTVVQAYPNCPKYIQQRKLSLDAGTTPSRPVTTRQGVTLGGEQKTLIADADTFFVASANPGHGVDASHRGGPPGFVRILNQQCLRIPDYAGNSLFNTLGNLTVYPHAGLLFLDFETGCVLQLTGEAKILWDQDGLDDQAGGTGRYWELDIKQWIETQLPRKLRWGLPDYSPYNPERQQNASSEPAAMKLVVTQIVQKTQRIKAFQLAAVSGAKLPAIKAGAHLPVRVALPDGALAYRQYSILSDPAVRNYYEIAVLLEPEGRGGSLFMHESVVGNQLIEVGVPRNDFPLSKTGEHHILIAGGIGVTPILSMLKSLVARWASLEVHYAARSVLDLAYRDEVNFLSAGRASFYHPDGLGASRLNLDQLLSKPDPDTHVYVCGPVRMIDAVRSLADTYHWKLDQIHFEIFGVSLSREDRAVTVVLSRLQKTISVRPSQTILDALSDAGVSVPNDCRRGECGMCATEVIDGQPDHRDLCLSSAERQHAMCLCVSRAKSEMLVLDL